MKPSKFIRKTSLLLLALVFCFLPLKASQASVPKLVTYHGILKNSSGNFLTGTYSMTFKIYNVSTGGTSLWSETQSSVSVSSGKFSVQLGSVTALNLDFSADYWLSIKVGTDAEMTPRVRLTSVGYAYMAEKVVNGFTQAQHDGLSHKNIEGVRDNTANIAKTNFKLDAYTLATANSMGDLVIDNFNDASGISSGSSTNYTWRGASNYDVIVTPLSGGNDSNTKLLLHVNGTDGSTIFTDSSSSGKSVTAFGNAQVDTAQSKFGGASFLLDGSGDYLSIGDSDDWAFGSGNFTLDMWVRFNTNATNQCFMSQAPENNNKMIFYNNGGGGLGFVISSAGADIISFQLIYTFSTAAWYHIAVVKTGSTYKFFVNGTQLGADASDSDSIPNFASSLAVGQYLSGNYFDGWMDEVRVSNVARWTSNFTPPSAEYGAGGDPGNATVISNVYSEPAAPTEAMVIPDETLGTGSITYYVSRDNGTTWTQCTKETVVNISSQPSGTQVKWKAVINGNAELNAIAVAV